MKITYEEKRKAFMEYLPDVGKNLETRGIISSWKILDGRRNCISLEGILHSNDPDLESKSLIIKGMCKNRGAEISPVVVVSLGEAELYQGSISYWDDKELVPYTCGFIKGEISAYAERMKT